MKKAEKDKRPSKSRGPSVPGPTQAAHKTPSRKKAGVAQLEEQVGRDTLTRADSTSAVSPKSGIRGKPNDGSKNPGGRPEEYPAQFFDDLSQVMTTWITKRYAQFQKNGTGDMWLGDFAFENGYSIQQLSRFANPEGDFKVKNAKFSQTYEWAKTAQGSWAIKDEKINAKIRQLLLVNFHDIKDKVETEHSGEIKSQIIQVELPKKD